MTPPSVSEEMIRALKPCPYCGGDAEQRQPEQPHGGMVNCRSCGAEAFGPKWNRRAHLPAGSEAVKPVAYLFRERFRDGKGGWWNWSFWRTSDEEVAPINEDHMQLECIAVYAAPPSTPQPPMCRRGTAIFWLASIKAALSFRARIAGEHS